MLHWVLCGWHWQVGSDKGGQGGTSALKPFGSLFLICQLNSNISFWQFYSTVKVIVSHLSSAFKIKFFVIIVCSVFMGCLISPETLIRLSTFAFKVHLEHR